MSATQILYLGDSGVGKSTAMRNLPGKETFVIKPGAKTLAIPGWKNKFHPTKATPRVNPLPSELDHLPEDDVNRLYELPGDGNLVSTSNITAINTYVHLVARQMPGIKYIIVEDLSHYFNASILNDEFLGRTKGNEAFQRWLEFGKNVYQALFNGIEDLRDDLFIIIIQHTEMKETGLMEFKTSGKLLDNAVNPQSYFTHVIHGLVRKGDDNKYKYLIQTNRDDIRFAKTLFGMFNPATEFFIPNDIVTVIDRIKKYDNGEIEVNFK